MRKPVPTHGLSRAYETFGELAAYITKYTPEFSVDRFLHMFIISGYAARFEAGDPCILYGMSGPELHHKVLNTCGISREDWPVPKITEKNSPAYQTGYLLALYQQNRALRFNDIINYIPFIRLISIFSDTENIPEKEALDIIDRKLTERLPAFSRLQARRKRLGLSQKELAAFSGVNLRTLQQYETGAKYLGHAAADKVAALSKALYCSPDELLEPSN